MVRHSSAQMFEGCSPESAGRPLELAGNGRPRWMTATEGKLSEQDPAYRLTRPSPALRHLVFSVRGLVSFCLVAQAFSTSPTPRLAAAGSAREQGVLSRRLRPVSEGVTILTPRQV